ncbi:MAG: hypothetical protein C4293_17535 [Nitrospiraceae bacterium]
MVVRVVFVGSVRQGLISPMLFDLRESGERLLVQTDDVLFRERPFTVRLHDPAHSESVVGHLVVQSIFEVGALILVFDEEQGFVDVGVEFGDAV